jgi:hypothetical protein
MIPMPDTQPDAHLPTPAQALAIYDQIVEEIVGKKADFEAIATARAVIAELVANADG